MSILLVRPSAGDGPPEPPPSPAPDDLQVPFVYARVAWREDALTRLSWDGSTTTGWTTLGTTLINTSSDTWGGGSSIEMTTGGTAGSGVTWSFGTATFTADREYRFRIAMRNVSGSVSTVLRLGTAADDAASTATITSGWAWYTVDWTPSADRTSVLASVLNGEAATQTTRYDHAEVYELDDEVMLDSLSIARGSRFDGGRESPGTIDFTVLDPDEVYTPRNPASPLYGYVKPGRRVHVRATYDGRLYALGYGVIREVSPDPFERKVSFHCEDGLFELDGYSIERTFSSDLAFYQARAAALSAEALASSQHDLATDSHESSTFYDGTDSPISLLDYLEALNEATGTIHVCVPHVEAIDPWRYRTITRATLTDDAPGLTMDEDFQSLSDVTARDESLVESMSVSWQGYEPSPAQVVVEATQAVPYWNFLDERFGSSDIPEPEDIFKLRRRKLRGSKRRRRKTVRRLKKVGERWVSPVVPITIAAGGTVTQTLDFQIPMADYSVAVTSAGDAVATLTQEVSRLTIALTSTAGDTVTALSVTASPYFPTDEATETVGREMPSLDNEYIVSRGAAEGLANYHTWRYGEGRLRPDVVDRHFPARYLTAEVGGHLTLSADRWHIDSDRYVIRALRHEVTGGGFEWDTTYSLEELPASQRWLLLGVADLGIVGDQGAFEDLGFYSSAFHTGDFAEDPPVLSY